MSDAPQIKEIAVPLESPSGTNPGGRVLYAAYAVTDGMVTMYDEDGNPETDRRGNRYEAPVIPGIAPEQVAARLAVRIREKLHGGDTGFNGRIDYPPEHLV